jgi:hypothetical protein
MPFPGPPGNQFAFCTCVDKMGVPAEKLPPPPRTVCNVAKAYYWSATVDRGIDNVETHDIWVMNP